MSLLGLTAGWNSAEVALQPGCPLATGHPPQSIQVGDRGQVAEPHAVPGPGAPIAMVALAYPGKR